MKKRKGKRKYVRKGREIEQNKEKEEGKRKTLRKKKGEDISKGGNKRGKKEYMNTREKYITNFPFMFRFMQRYGGVYIKRYDDSLSIYL